MIWLKKIICGIAFVMIGTSVLHAAESLQEYLKNNSKALPFEFWNKSLAPVVISVRQGGNVVLPDKEVAANAKVTAKIDVEQDTMLDIADLGQQAKKYRYMLPASKTLYVAWHAIEKHNPSKPRLRPQLGQWFGLRERTDTGWGMHYNLKEHEIKAVQPGYVPLFEIVNETTNPIWVAIYYVSDKDKKPLVWGPKKVAGATKLTNDRVSFDLPTKNFVLYVWEQDDLQKARVSEPKIDQRNKMLGFPLPIPLSETYEFKLGQPTTVYVSWTGELISQSRAKNLSTPNEPRNEMGYPLKNNVTQQGINSALRKELFKTP